MDVKKGAGITGKEAQDLLDKIHITVNKNAIPNDTENRVLTSGIRIGSPAMTTRGFKEGEFKEVGVPGKIILSIFFANSSLLVRINPPRGPRKVLCVVVVTISA